MKKKSERIQTKGCQIQEGVVQGGLWWELPLEAGGSPSRALQVSKCTCLHFCKGTVSERARKHPSFNQNRKDNATELHSQPRMNDYTHVTGEHTCCDWAHIIAEHTCDDWPAISWLSTRVMVKHTCEDNTHIMAERVCHDWDHMWRLGTRVTTEHTSLD